MRGTIAKRLRKEVYGEDFSPRHREYTWDSVKRVGVRLFGVGKLNSDKRRREYQKLKKEYRLNKIQL